ncbi:MAG: amino acid aminotransferase [Betaproteobacteria bacterium]
MPTSVFGAIEMAPRDPILGVTEGFVADQNPSKVNLGVGVYNDDSGKLPLLECVRQVEREMSAKSAAHGYLPIDGIAAYDKAAQTLVFGADSPLIPAGRVVTVQAVGGTGALKVAADFLRKLLPTAKIRISDPSWENHRALFEQAGFTVDTYRYYDAATHGLDFAGMIESIDAMPAGDIIVLHACCHNPTGVDPTDDQWTTIISRVRERGLVPLLDLAYQGFGDGVEADAGVVRRFAATPGPVLVASSFSKSFSLYGERVGALSIVTADAQESARVLSQVKRTVRGNYSSPPSHGGQIVAAVLASPELRHVWDKELAEMRDRIRAMRRQLVDQLKSRVNRDFSFVLRQRGMFSYSGLAKKEVQTLREQYSVYAIDTGRICVAALNSRNIEYVAGAIADVLNVPVSA